MKLEGLQLIEAYCFYCTCLTGKQKTETIFLWNDIIHNLNCFYIQCLAFDKKL